MAVTFQPEPHRRMQHRHTLPFELAWIKLSRFCDERYLLTRLPERSHASCEGEEEQRETTGPTSAARSRLSSEQTRTPAVPHHLVSP